jgi:hypothetical protein
MYVRRASYGSAPPLNCGVMPLDLEEGGRSECIAPEATPFVFAALLSRADVRAVVSRCGIASV